MNRGLALLLAIVAGGVVAFCVVAAGTAVLAGFLWIYVFGDDPWPDWVETGLNIAIPTVGLLLWVVASWRVFLRLTAT